MARSIIICKDCKEEKPLEADGLCSTCYHRRWRKENPEKCAESARRWRTKNPEYQQEWCEQNREKRRGYAQKYREDNLEEERERQRKEYKENPERNRKNWLKRKYNLTTADYDKLLEEQGNVCTICGVAPEDNGRHLDVDHDHSTGEVRGLLCHTCNKMLGLAQDNPQILIDAIEYLLKIKEV